MKRLLPFGLAGSLILLVACGATEDSPEVDAEAMAPSIAAHGHPDPEEVVFADFHELESYYDGIGYSFENWQAGMRAIPRAFPIEVPQRWHDVSGTVTVQHKKRLFFRALLPLVLRANELIADDRARAEKVLGSADKASAADAAWLVELASRYGVEAASADAVDGEALLERVDIVPASLALGQAAYESGYATSRFAGLGNALYGQWTWGGDGIKPDQQRKELGDHRIAAFKTPLDSIRAYQLNLNTHRAYAALRAKRAELRSAGKPIDGLTLADTLTKYSERGSEYVRTLKSIITTNRLEPTDDAYLRDDFETVLLVPLHSKDGGS